MTLTNFVKDNREELRRLIRSSCPNCGALPLSELKLWVQNDEGLYNWARSEGVRTA